MARSMTREEVRNAWLDDDPEMLAAIKDLPPKSRRIIEYRCGLMPELRDGESLTRGVSKEYVFPEDYTFSLLETSKALKVWSDVVMLLEMEALECLSHKLRQNQSNPHKERLQRLMKQHALLLS